MNAGALRHKIYFQKKTVPEPLDHFGSPQEDWATYPAFGQYDFWAMAAYETVGTREFPSQYKRNEEATVRFRLRYRSGIDADRYRIVFILDRNSSPLNVQLFDIFPPENPDGKRIELIIEAREVL